jgi:hypothetical protein
MVSSRKWKEFIIWWNEFKNRNDNKNTDVMDYLLILKIDNKIQEIKRGKNETTNTTE